jgi:hypothetical protein
VCLLNIFIKADEKVKYPAATVLLDLTANEYCIEKVGVLMKELNMFQIVANELHILLEQTIS